MRSPSRIPMFFFLFYTLLFFRFISCFRLKMPTIRIACSYLLFFVLPPPSFSRSKITRCKPSKRRVGGLNQRASVPSLFLSSQTHKNPSSSNVKPLGGIPTLFQSLSAYHRDRKPNLSDNTSHNPVWKLMQVCSQKYYAVSIYLYPYRSGPCETTEIKTKKSEKYEALNTCAL